MWEVFLTLSFCTVLASLAYALYNKIKGKKSGFPLNVILCTVFAANTLIFVPIYYDFFAGDNGIFHFFKTIMVSLHHAIRLFIVDSDFEIIKEMVPNDNAVLYYIYTCYAAVLFVLSPVLTFGFIFSFFKNLSARRKYLSGYNNDVYAFSVLNDKSVALAKSLKEKFSDITVIFTNATEESVSGELREEAVKFDAIFFEKDITAVNFSAHSRKKSISFFMFEDEEEQNTEKALKITDKYKERENTNIYVLLNSVEGELLLNAADSGKIKVRRISDTRKMIYNILQNRGENLFAEAGRREESEFKQIGAVMVGLGKYGSEMTKTLAWFCQMDNYGIEIDVFDKDDGANDRFINQCPELMSEKCNNHFDDTGESQYKITLHKPVEVDSISFSEEIKQLTKTTFVFVALGDDETNIRASVKLRMLFEQMGIKPRIEAVVTNPERKKALANIKNYSGQEYEIDFAGAVDEEYSYDNIINSELEQEALKRHLCWGEEEDFWKYEYNYRSSMASALHKRMKVFCKIPGIERHKSQRTEEELWNLRRLEHRRWNAYMRSEGYVYAEKRNNLAKTHNCLVSFDLLSRKEKEKDDD